MAAISIIIPVYNVENYIGRCVESIQNQTFADWELILVDDCSLDNSLNIIRAFAEKDHRIIVQHLETNHGPLIARRLGDSIATGSYITYCDGDDLLPPNALQQLYGEANKTGADIVSGDILYITIDGDQRLYANSLKYGNDRISAFRSLLRQELGHNLCGKLFKASLLKNYCYTSYEHFTNGEDGYIFYLALDHSSRIIVLNTPVYYYMQNVNSSSQRRLSEKAIEGICIFNMTRHSVISNYPTLKRDLRKRITTILCSLYSRSYDLDANLSHYILDYNLKDYVTRHNILRSCELRTLLRLLFSRPRLLIKGII